MLEQIYLPENIKIEEGAENEATFEIYPYHPGYGPTVGNALRRVLLSSLPGTAITHVKIENANHEFSTLPGVKEDLVSLILNLKQIRLASINNEPVEIKLSAAGKKKVTAADFELPPEISLATPKAAIANLTNKDSKLELRCIVEQGRGYVPSEAREDEQREIGMIAIDAVFTPVTRVSFRVENVRVGQATDYHKLILKIATDGTITPKTALNQAASILADHFKELTGDFEGMLTGERPIEEEVESSIPEEVIEPENTLNYLQLPSRVHNALERVGITTVEQVLDLTDDQIRDIPGLGEKAIHDIGAARDIYAKSKAQDNEAKDE